jgi:hypothetical protein
MQQVMDKAARIAAINDRFRHIYWGGTVVMTAGVSALPEDLQLRLFRAVSDFDDFNQDNDPHGEHDFGRVVLDACTYFWKIDCYDHTLCFGSEEAHRPAWAADKAGCPWCYPARQIRYVPEIPYLGFVHHSHG